MKTRLALLLTASITLLLLLAGCGRDVETVKRRYLANGEKYLAQGKVKEATIMFRNAIKRDPRFGEAYARLGDAELQRGEPVAALNAYRRAVELLPKPEESAGKLADIYLAAYSVNEKKDPRLLEEVKQLSNQLLSKDANSYHGLRLKGFLAVAAADYPSALAAFRKADQIRPKQPELRFALAQVLTQDNNWPEAEAIAVQMTKDSPTYTQIYGFLVVEYLRRNDAVKAEQILAQRTANNPKIVEFRLEQAAFYMGTNRKEQADKVLGELMAKEPEDKSIRTKVGDFLVKTRQYDRAMEVFKAGAEKYSAEKTSYRLRMAQVYLTQRKPKDAISVVDQALADDPKSNDALSMRASMQLQYGGKDQQQGAVTDLQALIGRDPANVVVRYNLARAYHTRGELDAARVQYDEAIKLSKQRFVAAYIGSGQVALAKRDFGRAMQDAEAVLKFDARNQAARTIKTNALINSGNLRQARLDLTEYLKDSANSPDLEFQLAITDFMEGKYKEAEAHFRSLRERFPNDARLLYALAEVMARTGRAKEGLQLLKVELQKTPDNRLLRTAVATAALRANELEVAESEYRTLMASDPKNLELYLRLGEVLRQKGQLQAAVEILRKGQQLAPTNPGANLQLALTLEAAGMKKEALPLYENVVKVDPDNAIAMNNLAFQYADLGRDLDMAMTYAQKAKQKLPNSDDVSDTMGWVYVKKQMNDNAISVFRELIKRQPKNPLYHYHLGYAQYQKGSKQDARQSLQTALSLKPGKEEEAQIRELLGKVG
jgi:tetratricopeptide (TPR) repeat protein